MTTYAANDTALTPNLPRVLIVEDSLDIRRGLVRLLNKDYQVYEAENGVEALEIFRQCAPDVILLDIMMPVMDGLEACQRIRALPEGLTVPILMVTSLDDRETIEKAFTAGATDYLVKPVQRLVLQNRVKHWVRAYTAERDLERRNWILTELDKLTVSAAGAPLQSLLDSVTRLVAEQLQPTSTYFWRYFPEQDRIQMVSYSLNANANSAEKSLDNLVKEDLKSRYPTVYNWLNGDQPTLELHLDMLPEAPIKDYFQAYGLKSCLLAQVRVKGELYGLLALCYTQTRHAAFLPEEILLIRTLIGRLGDFIHSALLYEELQHKEANLRHYTQELENLNREMDEYNSIIVHALKQPLALIRGYAETSLIYEGPDLPNETRETLTKISNFAQQMNTTVNELLSFSTISRAQANLESLDPRPIIEEVLHTFQNMLDTYHFEVELKLTPQAVYVDRRWVVEIFSNLISNAIKYRKPANPTPTLSIYNKTQGAFQRYYVQDDGLGIAPQDLERVFQARQRFHREAAPGHGMGLLTVKRLAEKMGGAVGVSSQLALGTTFWVDLPQAFTKTP